MQPFDPYHIWLAIPPEFRPPNFYQLLGLQTYESDTNVIANAADQRMAHVKSFANGPYGAQSQQLLNEISQAKINLINPELRAAHDAEIQARLAASTVAGLAESPKLAPADDLDDPIDQIVRPKARPRPATPKVIDESAAKQVVPLAEKGDESLFPSQPTEPAWTGPPPELSSNTGDFDVGVDHTRTRLGRKRSSSSSNMLVTLISAATIGSVVVLFIAKGCMNDNVGDVQNLPVVPVKDSAQSTPKPKPKPKPRPVDPESAIGDIAPPKPRPTVPDVATPPPSPVQPEPVDREDSGDVDAAVTDAIGGIAPPKPRVQPRPQPPVDTSPEPTPDPKDAGDVTPIQPVQVLPRAFYGSVGKSFRTLMTNDYEGYVLQRDTARKKATESRDPKAIAAVDRLEQMELATAKTWELVGISINALQSMSEIQTQSGATAAIVEAAPDKLVLRVSGQQRRYLSERRGQMNVFPKMSSKLVLLLANRVNEKSPQAIKALAFLRGLGDQSWPRNDAEMWEFAESVWNEGGAPPVDFFGLPVAPGSTTN